MSAVFVLAAACGGKTDGIDDGGAIDAALDVVKIKKDAAVDTGTTYQPLGKKCDPPSALPPPVWTPDDAGAPLHPPLVESSGGPVLKKPVFVPITFTGDDQVDPIEDFIASVGCSAYWRSVVSDYGVGDAYSVAGVHLTDAAPSSIDDSAIGVFLRNKIVSKELPDAVQNQTLYVIYYPDTTDITLQGEHSCSSFGGYHNEFKMSDGRTVPYAVIPRCGASGQLGGIDALTGTSSHELMEAATDPLPMSNPAYQFTESAGLAWDLAGGGEIGDLCEFNSDAFFLPSDYPFYVQHQWTNHAAFFAHDPCQPNTNVYVAAAPVLTDTISFDFGGGPQSAPGVKLALNQTTTFDVTVIADGPWTSTVTIDAHDAAHFFGGNTALTFVVTPTQANVGDTVKVQITRVGSNNQFGLEPFTLRATTQGTTRSWWVVVGDP